METKYNHRVITMHSEGVVWFVSIFAFIITSLIASNATFQWLYFIYAFPIVLIIHLVFNCVWFNYRKPRPPKNGAYFYSAKLNVPIISCFVEMVDMDEDDTEEFKKVKYVLHILDVLYPDLNKTPKENTEMLSQMDYNLKKECYEKVYGKELTYDFEPSDIAGWKKHYES